MNVLLIDPPTTTGLVSEKGGRNKLSTPFMGTLYIGTYLKVKHGAEVKVVDPQVMNLNVRSINNLVQSFQPDLVGITAKTFNCLGAFRVAEYIKKKKPDTVIVAGGAHPTALPDQTLQECPYIDAIVRQEGEHPFEEIYCRLEKEQTFSEEIFMDIPGVIFRTHQGDIIDNGESEFIYDLDSLPFPDLSLVDYSKYAPVYNPVKRKLQRCYPVFGSRGCPFNCSFCMPLLGRKHRVRSIENILDELELLYKKHGARRVYFEDSLFSSRKKRFEEFCEEYTSRGLHKKIQWGFETRIDTITPEEFRMAKEAGCIYTFFGVESGNEVVLKKNNKFYSRDSIISKVYSAKHAGIAEVNVSIIFGLPYETKETVQDTLSLLEIIPCDNASVNILDIYPGTMVAEMITKGEGGLRWVKGREKGWDKYSRETVMVEVNDLTESDLIDAMEKARRIMSKRNSKKKVARLFKMWAYSKELLMNDPKTFVSYAKETLAGKR